MAAAPDVAVVAQGLQYLSISAVGILGPTGVGVELLKVLDVRFYQCALATVLTIIIAFDNFGLVNLDYPTFSIGVVQEVVDDFCSFVCGFDRRAQVVFVITMVAVALPLQDTNVARVGTDIVSGNADVVHSALAARVLHETRVEAEQGGLVRLHDDGCKSRLERVFRLGGAGRMRAAMGPAAAAAIGARRHGGGM